MFMKNYIYICVTDPTKWATFIFEASLLKPIIAINHLIGINLIGILNYVKKN